MSTGWERAAFASAPVARLATARPDGSPHVVPFTFAVVGDRIYWAVDRKPKSGRTLQRLVNLEAEPRVSAVADHYEADWTRLWWVRADGVGRIASDDEAVEGLAALMEKYTQYRADPPPGPVVVIEVARWSGWRAGGEPGSAIHR
jgi:PPOX class probable F420-dependent enzyme